MNPVLLVIAGPNGSGKTTVTVRLRADQWSEGIEYLNPDEHHARMQGASGVVTALRRVVETLVMR